MATEILLIRHGETPSNAGRIVQTPDTPLSSRGFQQARLLERWFFRHMSQQTLLLKSELVFPTSFHAYCPISRLGPSTWVPVLKERELPYPPSTLAVTW